MRKVWVAAVLAGVAVVAGAAGGLAGARIAQSRVICSQNPCYVQMPDNGQDGLQIVDSNGPRVDNPFVIVDHNNAPMWWTNTGGSYSGDTQICVTGPDIFKPMEACLKPDGSLTLLAADGSTATLWPGDIRWIHTQRAFSKVR
jgi:hypothetical protein